MGKLVPEIHDIGKLIDKSLMGMDHNFLNIDSRFKNKIKDNPCWKGIRYHHDDKETSQDLDLFLLKLADRRAASVSRILTDKEKKTLEEIMKEKKDAKIKVHKLWNPNASKEFYPISEESDLENIIEYVNTLPCLEKNTQHIENFKDKLLKCPEDKLPGLNITSLLSHETNVGKFYRFFKNYKEEIKDEKGNRLKEIPNKDMASVENNIRIKLVKGRINFNSSPVRIKDLPVFEILKEFMEKIKDFDETIFSTSEEFLLVLPVTKNVNDLFEIDKSLNIEIEEAIAALYDVFPTPAAMKRRKESEGEFHRKELFEYRKSVLYGGKGTSAEPAPTLGPQICEICQMAEGTKSIPDEDSGISEILCDSCYKIRDEYKSSLGNIDDWKKVMWVKISLDTEELVVLLETLYKKYLDSLGAEKFEDSEIRFSVLSDFYMEYMAFLGELRSSLGLIDSTDCRIILNDFFAINMEKADMPIQVLRLYHDIFKSHFPELIHDSPVKLAVNICGVKYPFFNVWRSVHNLKDEIKITHPTKGTMRLKFSQLDFLLNEKDGLIKVKSRALHKLAEIENVSLKLAWTEMLQNRREYNPLVEAVMAEKFKIKDVLTYAKIMADTGVR